MYRGKIKSTVKHSNIQEVLELRHNLGRNYWYFVLLLSLEPYFFYLKNLNMHVVFYVQIKLKLVPYAII